MLTTSADSSSHAQVSNIPLVNVTIGHKNNTPTNIDVVADTGAQATVAGPSIMKRLGITQQLHILSNMWVEVGYQFSVRTLSTSYTSS